MQCPNTYDYTGNHIHLEKGFVKNLALVLAALLVLVVLYIVFMVVLTSLVPRLSLDDRNEARSLLYVHMLQYVKEGGGSITGEVWLDVKLYLNPCMQTGTWNKPVLKQN